MLLHCELEMSINAVLILSETTSWARNINKCCTHIITKYFLSYTGAQEVVSDNMSTAFIVFLAQEVVSDNMGTAFIDISSSRSSFR